METQSTKTSTIASALSLRVRESLSLIGLSRDSHIGNVDLSYATFFTNKTALSFIELVQAFYKALDPLEQLVFVNEYLEPGRHQKYWWLIYFKEPEFRETRIKIGKLATEEFGRHIYDANE